MVDSEEQNLQVALFLSLYINLVFYVASIAIFHSLPDKVAFVTTFVLSMMMSVKYVQWKQQKGDDKANDDKVEVI